MTRVDHYVLLRLRSGTGLVGHYTCRRNDYRFHPPVCGRYSTGHPAFLTLFKDKFIDLWRTWWQSHSNLGLGVPAEHRDNDAQLQSAVTVIPSRGGSHWLTQLIGSTRSLFHLGTADRCTRCLLRSCDCRPEGCCILVKQGKSKMPYFAWTHPGEDTCKVCNKSYTRFTISGCVAIDSWSTVNFVHWPYAAWGSTRIMWLPHQRSKVKGFRIEWLIDKKRSGNRKGLIPLFQIPRYRCTAQS